MKLEIPIIVGFDDMESLLDDLKKLQTYKCFEDAEEVLVDIEDVAEALMKHIKAKKSVKSDDLIGRADALSCFHDWIDQRGDVHTADEMPEYQRIERLPSAQPEPEDFEWCTDCKEYDQAQHCCHRWTKVIRQTVAEIKAEQPQPKTGKWMTDNPSDPYESDYCKCSVCGYTNCTVEVLAFDGYKFCPNCGTRMLKEGETHD